MWGNTSSPFCWPGVRWTIFVYLLKESETLNPYPTHFLGNTGPDHCWVRSSSDKNCASHNFLESCRAQHSPCDSWLLACISSRFMPEPTWRPPTALKSQYQKLTSKWRLRWRGSLEFWGSSNDSSNKHGCSFLAYFSGRKWNRTNHIGYIFVNRMYEHGIYIHLITNVKFCL